MFLVISALACHGKELGDAHVSKNASQMTAACASLGRKGTVGYIQRTAWPPMGRVRRPR